MNLYHGFNWNTLISLVYFKTININEWKDINSILKIEIELYQPELRFSPCLMVQLKHI